MTLIHRTTLIKFQLHPMSLDLYNLTPCLHCTGTLWISNESVTDWPPVYTSILDLQHF